MGAFGSKSRHATYPTQSKEDSISKAKSKPSPTNALKSRAQPKINTNINSHSAPVNNAPASEAGPSRPQKPHPSEGTSHAKRNAKTTRDGAQAAPTLTKKTFSIEGGTLPLKRTPRSPATKGLPRGDRRTSPTPVHQEPVHLEAPDLSGSRHSQTSHIQRSPSILVSRDAPLEGPDSYFMACCPFDAKLGDQPCLPRWCFSYQYIDWLTTSALILCFCWGAVYAVSPKTASPGGALYTLVAVSILAYAAGWTSEYFMRLPPGVIMLVVGSLYRNSPLWDMSSHFDVTEDEAVKSIVMTVMATKAALYFDGKVFSEFPVTILLLGIVPCIVEILAIGVLLSNMSDFDVVTCLTTATVLATVSSTIISHALVTLAKAGYGAQSGIISVLMAAGPIDTTIVFAILGYVAKEDQNVTGFLVSIAEQLGGIMIGALLGLVLAFFPSRRNANATLQRTVLLILSMMSIHVMSRSLDVTPTGYLFNTAVACSIVNFWRIMKWHRESIMLKDTFEMIWHALQPVATILICSIVDFARLSKDWIGESVLIFIVGYVISMDIHKISKVIVVVSSMLTLRVGLTFLSTHFSRKPIKQRIFISLCWTSRGLTQGVLAGSLIKVANRSNTEQQTQDIMTIFVINMILGSILGSLQLWFLGPLLVPKNESFLKP